MRNIDCVCWEDCVGCLQEVVGRDVVEDEEEEVEVEADVEGMLW